MKREYKKPLMQRVTMHPSEDIAAVCWGHAPSKKTFYHDIPGLGYAILHMEGSNCDSGNVILVEFPTDLGLTSAQIAAGRAYMEERIAYARATAGNSGEPYKGSIFSAKVDKNWS